MKEESMGKITITITEEDIKRQLIDGSINWDIQNSISLRAKNIDPYFKEVCEERIKQIVSEIDTDEIIKKAKEKIDNQLRSMAKKLLE